MSTQVATDTRHPGPRRRLVLRVGLVIVIAAVIFGAAGWLIFKASIVKSELEAASRLLPQLKATIIKDDPDGAAVIAAELAARTSAAKSATLDPVWTVAAATPWIGPNFQAAGELAVSADDVTQLGVVPLSRVFRSIDWRSLVPSAQGVDLAPLVTAQPTLDAAARVVEVSADRLNGISTDGVHSAVSTPLEQARQELDSVRDSLAAAASLADLAPAMLGADAPRSYLLMIQNNAETRASGGIPGALAVLRLDNGRLKLGEQSSATDIGVMSPVLAVDPAQQEIYSGRLGKYMQDVNLTPDFPTAAATAHAMWAKKTGQRVDGVISIDPVVLGYFLRATGPVKLSSPELVSLAGGGLPTELNAKNVLTTLLSDVYAKIARPELQDRYFAGVAQEVFAALSSGKADANALIEGITRGAAEGRVLIWSAADAEQGIISTYSVGGSISGPSIAPAQFGVYFNDGTGAKMDYHVKRTVQLIEECPNGEYGQMKVRIASTNTAPKDAATSLPEYVTGGGAFGVPAGTVQTNIVAYGPVQSNVETAIADGKKISFASQVHSGRPVGTVTVALPPGKSSTVEFTFGKIVQHTEPKLSVTPTVQAREDVVLDTAAKKCVPAA